MRISRGILLITDMFSDTLCLLNHGLVNCYWTRSTIHGTPVYTYYYNKINYSRYLSLN